jgi:hypothetical protein
MLTAMVHAATAADMHNMGATRPTEQCLFRYLLGKLLKFIDDPFSFWFFLR